MTEQQAEALADRLRDDLATLGDLLRDDSFAEELYRALTNRVWRKEGMGDAHVSLSWKRAEELVAELRRSAGAEELPGLAGSGGEGELSDRVERALAGLGWHSQPLDTSRHDDRHLAEEAAAPPPPDAGERHAPTPPPDDLRRVHEDIDRGAVKKDSAGAEAAGGGEPGR